METFAFINFQGVSDEEIMCDGVKCSLCDGSPLYKSTFYDGTFCQMENNCCLKKSSVTSPCCMSILCPMCLERKNNDMVANYLFIRSMIYLQDNENYDFEPFEDTSMNECHQYNWVLYKPINSSSLDEYQVVNKKYDKYIIDNENDENDYSFTCALCECKNCGFKCTALNYANS